MLALVGDGLACHQAAPDVQKFVGHLVALVVIEKQAVAMKLDGIAAGDDIDQQTAVGDAIERRRHARRPPMAR